MPTPETRHPRSPAEALAAARELGYPVIVKPSDPIGFKRLHNRQGFRCETAAELEAAFAQTEAFEPMVQEYVPGGDDHLYSLGSYVAAETARRSGSSPAASCARHASTWACAGWPRPCGCRRSPTTACGCCAQLEFSGISQVEFKLDPRTGTYKLIEVNPRLWQWHGLATACGVDLTHIAYLDLVGRRPPARRMTREGRRWAITFSADAPHAVPAAAVHRRAPCPR